MTDVIVALDFSSEAETIKFLEKFEKPIFVKVGMELFYKCGNSIIEEIKKRNHKIFLDLKLHDIPNTVKQGLKNLTLLGVDMINVHCAGGKEMMKAGLEGIKEAMEIIKSDKKPLYIGVTQLTSTSKEAMNNDQGIQGEVIDSVLRYGKLAKESGLDGVVSSVFESRKIHEICGDDFITVNPGIRLLDDAKDDQKRVASPQLAKEEGSNFIVVGRSITKSPDPVKTYNLIKKIVE